MAEKERYYHVVVVDDRTGKRTRLTSYPATHREACAIKSKQTPISSSRKHLRYALEEVVKRPKLQGRTKELASEYIAEEMRTRQYPRKQAIAIGISRAKAESKKVRTMNRIHNLLSKYQ